MKKNKNKYREVTELPKTALTVAQYALNRECNTSYLYQLVREDKAEFEIVIFKTINFIIPKKK